MKIAVITCYSDPDYVRARSIRLALKKCTDVKMIVVKNKRRGLLRYPEIFWKLWKTRRDENPDVYLLTFRGQEILPFVLLLARKKTVWFDEFIVPIAYAKDEHHHRSATMVIKHTLARLSEALYRRWLIRCKVIFADTSAHAELSARTSNLNLRKFVALPVGADEKLFKPAATSVSADDPFTVFFYGSMLPLHGVGTIVEAVELLKGTPNIQFEMVGGNRATAKQIKALASSGAPVHYRRWIPFADLPAAIQQASLCLGGPFGNTPQANHVITGKTYQFLACAVPTVIGISEATAEYFTDKQNALMVPQADAEALAKAIRWAASHPSELAAIAADGRKLYDKQFSTTAIARRLQVLVDAGV